MRVLFILFLVFPILMFSQNQITINVYDVPSSKGKICIAIYNREEGFLKLDNVYMHESIPASQGMTHTILTDIPEGEYALAVFHDENGNNKLDTNWLGIPKEKIAFSNAKMKTFGPPKYEECAFKAERDTRIKVTL